MRPDIGSPVTDKDVDQEFSSIPFGEEFETSAASQFHHAITESSNIAATYGEALNPKNTELDILTNNVIPLFNPATPEEIKPLKDNRPGLYIPPNAPLSVAEQAADYYDKDQINNAIANQGYNQSLLGKAGYYSGGFVGGLASPESVIGIAAGGGVGRAAVAGLDLILPSLTRYGVSELAGQASSKTSQLLTQVLGPEGAGRRLIATLSGGAGYGLASQEAEEVQTYNQDKNLKQNYDFLEGAHRLYTSTWQNMLIGGALHLPFEIAPLTRAFKKVNASFKDNPGPDDGNGGNGPSDQEFVKNNYAAVDQNFIQNANVDALGQAADKNPPNVNTMIKMGQIEAGKKFRASMDAQGIDPNSLLEDIDKSSNTLDDHLTNWFQSYKMPANFPLMARALADEIEKSPHGDFSTNAIVKALKERFPNLETAQAIKAMNAEGERILSEAQAKAEAKTKFIDTPIGKMISDFKDRFNYPGAEEDINHFAGEKPLETDQVSQQALYQKALKGEVDIDKLPKAAKARVKNFFNIRRLKEKAQSFTNQYKEKTKDMLPEEQKAIDIHNEQLHQKAIPYIDKAEALAKNRVPHVTPESEMDELRGKLFSGKEPRNKFKAMKAYARLKELSRTFHRARNMLLELHLKDSKSLEKAYGNLWARSGNELLTQKALYDSMRNHINDTHPAVTPEEYQEYIKYFNNPIPKVEEVPGPSIIETPNNTEYYLNNYPDEKINKLLESLPDEESSEALKKTMKDIKNKPIYDKMIDKLTTCELG